MNREVTIIINLLMYIPESTQRFAWESLKKELDLKEETLKAVEEDYFGETS